jgi:hypothetical protein
MQKGVTLNKYLKTRSLLSSPDIRQLLPVHHAALKSTLYTKHHIKSLVCDRGTIVGSHQANRLLAFDNTILPWPFTCILQILRHPTAKSQSYYLKPPVRQIDGI